MAGGGVMQELARAARELFEQGHRATEDQVGDLDLHRVVYGHVRPEQGYRWASRGMVRETIRKLALLTEDPARLANWRN